MQKFEQLSKEHQKILIDIQKSIPKEWTDRVVERQDIAPVSKEIMERAIQDPEVDEETKKEFQLVLDSGFFDNKVDVEQEIVSDLINAYVEKEVIKAVIAKKLPKLKKKIKFDDVYKNYQNKLEIYERKYN
jgi:hypothetical protein